MNVVALHNPDYQAQEPGLCRLVPLTVGDEVVAHTSTQDEHALMLHQPGTLGHTIDSLVRSHIVPHVVVELTRDRQTTIGLIRRDRRFRGVGVLAVDDQLAIVVEAEQEQHRLDSEEPILFGHETLLTIRLSSSPRPNDFCLNTYLHKNDKRSIYKHKKTTELFRWFLCS